QMIGRDHDDAINRSPRSMYLHDPTFVLAIEERAVLLHLDVAVVAQIGHAVADFVHVGHVQHRRLAAADGYDEVAHGIDTGCVLRPAWQPTADGLAYAGLVARHAGHEHEIREHAHLGRHLRLGGRNLRSEH